MNVLYMAAGGVLVAAIAGGAGYIKGASAGRAEIQQAWDQEKAKLAEEYAKAQAAAREKEQQLQAQADHLRQEKDDEIRSINARVASLSDSLRKRPERTAQASAVSGATGASCPACVCTGAGLSREDAEFLAREAARADELRASLTQCVKQYEALRPATR
jgi:hypothetical protein